MAVAEQLESLHYCPECGRGFLTSHGMAIHAGRIHRIIGASQIERICKQCGETFPASPSKVRTGKGKFCNRVCFVVWETGRSKDRGKKAVNSILAKRAMCLRRKGQTLQAIANKFNAEGKRTARGCEFKETTIWNMVNRVDPEANIEGKSKASLRGTTLSAEHKRKISKGLSGSNHYFYGKHHSEEHKRELSDALRGIRRSEEHKRKISDAMRGTKHWRWKGGPIPYGLLWPFQRNRARNRDNYTCQRCGIAEKELGHALSVHHIRPFRESKDNSVENLVCLCDLNDNGCHSYCEHHPEECPQPRKHWLLPSAGEQLELLLQK